MPQRVFRQGTHTPGAERRRWGQKTLPRAAPRALFFSCRSFEGSERTARDESAEEVVAPAVRPVRPGQWLAQKSIFSIRDLKILSSGFEKHCLLCCDVGDTGGSEAAGPREADCKHDQTNKFVAFSPNGDRADAGSVHVGLQRTRLNSTRAFDRNIRIFMQFEDE